MQFTQNKGNESENFYQKLKKSRWTGTRTHTRKQNQNISTDTAVFVNQKRANVCEHTTKTWSVFANSFEKLNKYESLEKPQLKTFMNVKRDFFTL